MAATVSGQDTRLSSSNSASNDVGTTAAGLPKRNPRPLPWEREYSPISSGLPRVVGSKLCDVCLAFEENCLRPWPLSHEKDITVYLFPHHGSWEALELSCRNGCELCTLFKNGYLENYQSQKLRDAEQESNETDSEDSQDSVSEADRTSELADTKILVHHTSSRPTLDSDNRTDSEDSTEEEAHSVIQGHHKSSPQSLDGAGKPDLEDGQDGQGAEANTIITDYYKSTSESLDDANEADLKLETNKLGETTISDYYNSLRIRCELPRSSSDPIRCCFIPGRRQYSACFNIGAEKRSKPAEEGGFRGRMCSATPDFDLAKEWIRNCDSHGVCKSRKAVSRQNPARLLQIFDASSQIRLVVTADSDHYDYTTLSHRWGREARKPSLTLRENLLQHMSGLAINNLPATFKDAVLATVSLGYEYVWIDSLCIIQDDPEDFERECPKMASIYSGSAITIAAPGAQDSYSGFLQTRKFLDDPLYTPVELQYRDHVGKSDGTLTLWYPGSTSTPGHFGYLNPSFNGALNSPYGDEPRPSSFLDNRGWIFQEWLLSPRVLYFGSFQMYFECFQSQRFETLHDPHEHIDHFNLSKNIPPLISHTAYHSWWYKLVQRYSGCALSVAKDRLPAISGIAHSYQPPVPDKYLAGIWQGDLPSALLWYRSSYYEEKDDMTSSSEIEYIAPSWSWASVTGSVRYMLYKNHKILDDPYDASEVPDQWNLHIISASTSLRSYSIDPDPFGPVKEGYLRVRGKLHDAAVFKRRDRTLVVSMQKHAHSSLDGAPWLTLHFFPDEPSRYQSLPRLGERWERIGDIQLQSRNTPKVLVLPILMTRNSTFHSYVGLALEPVMEFEGEFRRVGLVKGTSKAKERNRRDELFTYGNETELVIR